MLRLNDYRCPDCGFEHEIICDPDEPQECPMCEHEMARQFPAFKVNTGPVPVTGYYDDNLQSFVRTNTHRKQLMEEQGVTEKGATPKENRHAWV